jgi:hypothetical protein
LPVKLDVQGHELAALKGMKILLRQGQLLLSGTPSAKANLSSAISTIVGQSIVFQE